jgi:hypothetical protein
MVVVTPERVGAARTGVGLDSSWLHEVGAHVEPVRCRPQLIIPIGVTEAAKDRTAESANCARLRDLFSSRQTRKRSSTRRAATSSSRVYAGDLTRLDWASKPLRFGFSAT